MKINDIAKRLGLTPRAIRLYEEKGLLRPKRESDNGYRYYTEHDAWRLQTIASFRDIGLSLQQIERLLEEYDRGNSQEVHHYLEMQRMVTAARWVELKYLLSSLDELISRFEAKQRLELDDLFELARKQKHIQHSSDWIDRWNFDYLADRYDHSAASIAAGSFLTPSEYDNALELMTQWVAPQAGEQGLDIGAGTGNLSGRLWRKGASMYAIDQSKEMLNRCRDKYPEIQQKLGNALSVPFTDSRFEFVVSAFAYHHLEQTQQLLALEEMNRVLKPHGRICICGLMFENEHAGSRQAFLETSSDKHPIDRSKLLEWFHAHNFITVQHQLNEWIHVVYAVRRN